MYSSDYAARAGDLVIDQVSLQEPPASTPLNNAVPHLKSVDLSWTPSTIGAAFKRYEVYRATHPTVTTTDTRVGQFTGVGTTSMTDSGLSIGTTYYYGLFVVDQNEVYSLVSERSATTVPLAIGFTDPMENLNSWDASGSWGVDTSNPAGGSASLSDSPNADYVNSLESQILTSVNLTGSVWPVLRFKDRYTLASGDWTSVEVSANGGGWTRLYGAYDGARATWALQEISLLPWRSVANLRIRFVLRTDGAVTADGWFIDDVSVTDQPMTVQAMPWLDGFESGLSNWMSNEWRASTNAYAGVAAAEGPALDRLAPDSYTSLEFARVFNLLSSAHPQLTYFFKPSVHPGAYFRAQYCTDGTNWGDLPLGVSNLTGPWQRAQIDLTPYRVDGFRFRFVYSSDYAARAGDMVIDQVSLQEPPVPVTLQPLDEITVSTQRLQWSAYTGSDFLEYRIYRSSTPNVTEGSTLVATFPQISAGQFTDTGLTARNVYYYKVYVYNTRGVGWASNEASARLLGLPMGATDAFETASTAWTFSGPWTLAPGAGRGGTTALTDSAGDYALSVTTYAQTAVNLATAVHPVVKFWDYLKLNGGDWMAVEISPDGGSWSRVYGGYETVRESWAEQQIDLSPWKGRESVYIRFILRSDGGTPGDGWYLDDFSVQDIGAVNRYPLIDGVESDASLWMNAGWQRQADDAAEGAACLEDTPGFRHAPDTYLYLSLAGTLDLSQSVAPELSYSYKANMHPGSWFRAQLSTDAGVNWFDLPGGGLDYPLNADWTLIRIPLTAYRGPQVRLRFLSASDYAARQHTIKLDRIAVGDPTPGTPSLHAPGHLALVETRRPVLTVNNAVDYQADPLTYRFEVYSDAALANLVASVPGVAQGLNRSSWTVDVDLPDNAQFWWRCRASDGVNASDWMSTASFFVTEVNNLPLVVVPAGPVIGGILPTLQDRLAWYPSEDPDEGDSITGYHIQIARDVNFTSLVLSDATVAVSGLAPGADWAVTLPLGSLAGSAALVAGESYAWRIRAKDERNAWSAWNAGAWWFTFGASPPNLRGLAALPGGAIQVNWQRGAGTASVYWSPTLTPPAWQRLAEDLIGEEGSVTPPPGSNAGFFRVELEPATR